MLGATIAAMLERPAPAAVRSVAPASAVTDLAPAPTLPAAPVAPPTDTRPPDGPSADRTIVVVARRPAPGDPVRAINRTGFAATQFADRAVVGPVAGAYREAVPHPLRRGVHNFLYNLYEPEVALAFLLQRKPGKAAETVGRFVVNSTIGLAGVLDVASRRPFRLPRRTNGFADTFGFYGIGPGPYLFLPLIGATTLRDIVGDTLDGFAAPSALGRPFDAPAYTITTAVLRGLDHRVQADPALHLERDRGVDAYRAERRDYLGMRRMEIDHLRYGGPIVPTTTVPPPLP